MEITLKQINNEKVKPLPIQRVDAKKVKGYNMFNNIYANIFLLAPKNSGKTTTLFHILKKCIDKDTRLIIFSSTAHKDSAWLHILEQFKQNPQEIYTAVNGQLSMILEELQLQAEEEQLQKMIDKEERKEKRKYVEFGELEPRKKRNKKKKKVAPELIFIFDDMGTDLRSAEIGQLLKKNRHFKSKVILSSQYIHDLKPESIRQLDYVLAFKGLSDGKLPKIYNQLGLSISFPVFEKLYNHATKERYCFLYIDIIKNVFRNCFNKQYLIK